VEFLHLHPIVLVRGSVRGQFQAVATGRPSHFCVALLVGGRCCLLDAVKFRRLAMQNSSAAEKKQRHCLVGEKVWV
jgi:hypothetical protein